MSEVDINKFQFALRNYIDKQELIRFADTKAAAILLVCGVLLGGYYNVFKAIDNGCARYILVSIFILGILTTLVIVLLRVLSPRIGKSDGSLIFPITSHITQKAYEDKFHDAELSDIEAALISQTYIVAEILDKKHKNLQLAFWILCIALVSFVVSVFFAIS